MVGRVHSIKKDIKHKKIHNVSELPLTKNTLIKYIHYIIGISRNIRVYASHETVYPTELFALSRTNFMARCSEITGLD